MRFMLLPLLLVLSFSVLGEEATQEKANKLRAQGLAALKVADDDPKALVLAAETFAYASDVYVELKMEREATEMNSYLFWCRKKMNLEQIEAYTRKGPEAQTVVKKMDAVVNLKVEDAQAQSWFDRAEKFVTDEPDDHFGAAVRFFEVAQRFKGSDVGLKATDRTLQEMQKIKAAKDAAAGSKESVALGMAPETFLRKLKVAYENTVQKARGDFETTERVARTEYIAGLERVAAEVTKQGNLKLANQINEEKEAYALSARIPKLTPFASDPFTSRFIGGWKIVRVGNANECLLMFIDQNGACNGSWDPRGALTARGVRRGNVLFVRYPNGWVHEIRLSADGAKINVSSWNAGKWSETARTPADGGIYEGVRTDVP